MFIEERHARILELLEQNGRISISQLQEEFSISDDSIRRDLRMLEEKNLLKRTHGGAIPVRQVGMSRPKNMTSKDMDSVYPNYLAIAKKAVSMIKPMDVVYITWASVGYLMAQNMSDIPCKVVTNSIIIAEELRPKEKVQVLIIGGTMDMKGICRDDFPITYMSNLRFDKSFVTSACISANFGLSINNPEGAKMILASIMSAKYKIGLYPTEKIGFESNVKIADVAILNEIITDWDALEDELVKYEEAGVKVTIVENDENSANCDKAENNDSL